MGEFLTSYWKAQLTQGLDEVKPRPGFEVVTMIVTVKAYPAIGRKNGEGVCVAGIRIDTPSPQWIRLFPVNFRGLDEIHQFKKWQVIRLRVQRGTSDRRAESYTPDLSTLQLGQLVDTQSGTWERRWQIVDGLIDTYTACEFHSAGRAKGQAAPSLGLITPAEIKGLEVGLNPDYLIQGSQKHEQLSLFGEPVKFLEPPPFIAKYTYTCREPSCRGHDQTLIDWESGVFARKRIRAVGLEAAMVEHHDKFFTQLCSPSNDTKFFLGNQHNYPHGFLVLGVFYPKKGSQPAATLDF